MTNGKRFRKYWEKCCENRDVSEEAQANGQFSAAASRYYYALRFAAGAYFVKKNLDDIIDDWPTQPDFVKKASGELDKICPYIDVQTWFNEALKLRTRGDYKDVPVLEMQLKLVIDELNGIFSVIEGEIRGQK